MESISENAMKLPLLRLIAEKGGTVEFDKKWSTDGEDIEKQLGNYFGLTETQRNKKDSAGHSKWRIKIQWVRKKLIEEDGWLINDCKFYWPISDNGYEHLAKTARTDKPLKITYSKDIGGNKVFFVPELKALPAEGSELFLHRKIELYSDAALLAKQHWLQSGKRYFECELCKFSFWKKYGSGDYSCVYDYIEAHLLVSPTTRPKIDDFKLVCANCHSLLHNQSDLQILRVP